MFVKRAYAHHPRQKEKQTMLRQAAKPFIDPLRIAGTTIIISTD